MTRRTGQGNQLRRCLGKTSDQFYCPECNWICAGVVMDPVIQAIGRLTQYGERIINEVAKTSMRPSQCKRFKVYFSWNSRLKIHQLCSLADMAWFGQNWLNYLYGRFCGPQSSISRKTHFKPLMHTLLPYESLVKSFSIMYIQNPFSILCLSFWMAWGQESSRFATGPIVYYWQKNRSFS